MPVGCSPTRSAVTPGTVRLVSKIAELVKLTTATSPVWVWVTAPKNWASTSGANTVSVDAELVRQNLSEVEEVARDQL